MKLSDEANKWKKNRINRSMWRYFKLFAGNYTWMSNKNCTKTSKPVIVCCCTGVCVFSLNGQEKLDLISSHLLWLMDIINEMTFKNHPSFFFYRCQYICWPVVKTKNHNTIRIPRSFIPGASKQNRHAPKKNTTPASVNMAFRGTPIHLSQHLHRHVHAQSIPTLERLHNKEK